MSFKEYIKEQEELQILDQEQTKKQKLADFFRTMEDLNDDKFRAFASDELGMEEDEAETIVYKMLRDFLLKDDKDEDGIPDEDGDMDIDDLDTDDLASDLADDALDIDGSDEEGGLEDLTGILDDEL